MHRRSAPPPFDPKEGGRRRKLPCPYGRVVGSPRWAAGFPGNPAAIPTNGLVNDRMCATGAETTGLPDGAWEACRCGIERDVEYLDVCPNASLSSL
eukprot:1179136-Prorocentrum_minimum.AAC.1